MKRLFIWLLVCFSLGGMAYPVARWVFWEYRAVFVPGYDASRSVCEVSIDTELTQLMEENPSETLAGRSDVSGSPACQEFLVRMLDYQDTLAARAGLMSLLVLVSLGIIRFVMFPIRTLKTDN